MDSEEKGRLRRSNVELMRGHHANKRIYETILGDLRAYDSYSGGLFDDLDSIDVQLIADWPRSNRAGMQRKASLKSHLT